MNLAKKCAVALLACLTFSAHAGDAAPAVGIVLMHGKGGAPSKYVADLAGALERRGLLVENLEMPWSGRRDYDVDVDAAEKQVAAALAALRRKGADKLFVAGHSQGGVFALYFGGRQVVDGVIAIARGGDVGSAKFRENLREPVELARQLVASGQGGEKTRLADYEGAKGSYPVIVAPSVYLGWFDPEGAMNEKNAILHMNAATPVLFIAPANDYPGLLRVKQELFDALPSNPRTQLYEPNSSHLNAPSASVNAIAEWTLSGRGSR